MKCPNCDIESVSAGQIDLEDGKKGCFVCKPDGKLSNINLHIKGINKYAPKMSYADIQHIKSRRIDPETKRVVYAGNWR